MPRILGNPMEYLKKALRSLKNLCGRMIDKDILRKPKEGGNQKWFLEMPSATMGI